MRGLLVALIVAADLLLAGSAGAGEPTRKAHGPAKTVSQPVPPPLPVPAPLPIPEVAAGGTAGRALHLGGVTITPGGFVGLDGQTRARP